MDDSTGFFITSVIIIGGVLFYFLPYIIGRNKRNSSSIFWLNLLLGWSLIGWVVALVWAVSKDPEPVIINNTVSNDPDLERLTRYKKLLDDGVISQSEFDSKKNEILNK